MNRKRQVEVAASWVAGYLGEQRDPQVLLGTPGLAFQLYEAAVTEYDHWDLCSDIIANQAKETCQTRWLPNGDPPYRDSLNFND